MSANFSHLLTHDDYTDHYIYIYIYIFIILTWDIDIYCIYLYIYTVFYDYDTNIHLFYSLIAMNKWTQECKIDRMKIEIFWMINWKRMVDTEVIHEIKLDSSRTEHDSSNTITLIFRVSFRNLSFSGFPSALLSWSFHYRSYSNSFFDFVVSRSLRVDPWIVDICASVQRKNLKHSRLNFSSNIFCRAINFQSRHSAYDCVCVVVMSSFSIFNDLEDIFMICFLMDLHSDLVLSWRLATFFFMYLRMTSWVI